jgi:signal transduction histidine kinase
VNEETAAHALVAGLPPEAPVGFAILDERLEIVLASPLVTVFPAELAPAAEQALAGHTVTRVEFAAPGEGGERHWQAWLHRLEVAGRPLLGLVLADVTDRTLASEALRESESQLSAAQSIARMGWWLWTFEPPLMLFSAELAAMMGFPTSDPTAGDPETLLSRVLPEERPRIEADIAAAAAEARPLQFSFTARRADGALLRLVVHGTPVLDTAGTVSGLAGFTQDVTARERAGAQRRAVADLGRLGLGDAATDELLRCACELVRRALTVDRVAVHPAAADDGLAGAGTTSVPVDTPLRRFGLLTVETAAGSPLGDEDMTFLLAISHVLGEAIGRRETAAEIAGLAAARGRLVAQALDAEGRARAGISERLHDGPLQDVLAAGHDLYGLGDGPEAREALEGARAIARDLREAMVALHPTVLQYGGLGAALRAVAEQQARTGGFRVAVTVDEGTSGQHDELLLSTARRLLAGVARHAGASEVTVRLERAAGELRLEVVDDGEGRPLGADAGGEQVSLAATAERVAAVGGRFEAGPRPNGGSRVSMVLPVDE